MPTQGHTIYYYKALLFIAYSLVNFIYYGNYLQIGTENSSAGYRLVFYHARSRRFFFFKDV